MSRKKIFRWTLTYDRSSESESRSQMTFHRASRGKFAQGHCSRDKCLGLQYARPNQRASIVSSVAELNRWKLRVRKHFRRRKLTGQSPGQRGRKVRLSHLMGVRYARYRSISEVIEQSDVCNLLSGDCTVMSGLRLTHFQMDNNYTLSSLPIILFRIL